jgi:heterodisulfide reductase subunit A
VIVEQAANLGGKAAGFGCKAAGRCVLCGACIVSAAMEEVTAAGIDTRFNTAVTAVRPADGGFDVTLAGNARLAADGIIVATGHVNFNPSDHVEYGYATHPDIITGYELEEMVRGGGGVRRRSDQTPPRTIAFIQCVGSREIFACGNYCSVVCCKYALRFAALLKHRDPACAVTLFMIDVQRGGKDFRPFHEEVRAGLTIIHGRPVVTAADRSGITLKFKDEATGRMERRAYDLVVLSTGIKAAPQNAALADLLGLPVDADGFLAPHGRVQVAGTAGRPMSVPDAMRSGEAAARALMREAVDA